VRIQCRDLEVGCHDFGRGDPLLLVHGLADDHRAWRRLIPSLALHHRVIAYDVRGHGETTLGRPQGTLAQLAEDLVALMDALDLERADWVGFSLGGTIVLRGAIDHPQRVRRLLPVATSSRVGRAVAPWYRERAELAGRGPAALHEVLERDTRDQLATAPQEFEEHWLIRRQSTRDPRGFANACRAMAGLAEQPLDPDLGRVAAPTLVVAGDLDRHCPVRAGEIIRDGIPGSELRVIAGAGHQVEVEKPEELAALIAGFIAAD
jgi:3-oxoadipate enol-lactonase